MHIVLKKNKIYPLNLIVLKTNAIHGSCNILKTPAK